MLIIQDNEIQDKKGNVILEVFDERYKKQVNHVSTHLRSKDFNEVFASTGQSPHLAVLEGWELSSRRWMIFNKRAEPVAVLGVRPVTMLSEDGVPWFLGTDGLDDMKKFFLRISKPIIAQMKVGFKVLVNYVDARYIETVRWLIWCGFTMEEPAPFGALQLPFHRFGMRCNNG